ncbi:hypothetical protein C8R46DRAFT_1229041 [Mycena filopes]|nr:hypothetical protein C8R46DRAFT_1229041 [Mycena filopes]
MQTPIASPLLPPYRKGVISPALCIHTNAYALLIPVLAHLSRIAWLDRAGTTTLASGILAIITAAVCCILSSKYGVTAPVHEAGAFVVTVHIVSVFLTSEAFWTASSPLPYIYVLFSIPITVGIWKAAIGAFSVDKSDGLHEKLALA